jgi:hypothetical protein
MAQSYDASDLNIVNGVLEGDLGNLPAINSKIVRIFTSSTFTGKNLLNFIS